MPRQVRVFLNSKSGGGEASAQRIRELFAQFDCACEITEVNAGTDMGALAAADPEDVAFIAAGGDGTVNAVACAVQSSGRRMGVLPVGTLNHFAKDAGIPLELEAAVRVAAGDQVRALDAAEVNGQLFVNNSSIGVYPAMVQHRERMKKGGWNRWTSLVYASAKAFVRFRCLGIELEAEGKVQRSTTPLLFVGNNEYCMEGFELGKRARLDRGELSLYLAPGASRSSVLRLFLAALAGRCRDVPEYAEFKVQRASVRVRGSQRLRVSLDGEVRRMRGPLEYCVLPNVLQVLCPPAASPPAENPA